MHGPASAGWLLVALCAAMGAYCLLRMRSPVTAQRTGAGGEALMGFGMALMAVPAAVLTQPAALWWAYVAVFGAAAAYEVGRARRAAHHLHHLVGALAMVYMALAMASGGHHGAGGVPLLTGALLVYYAAYVLRSGVRLMPAGAAGSPVPGSATAAGGGPGAGTGWGDRTELAMACRLSMGIAMFAMLLTM
ncbi:DUF5134 domain-containing protein [Streptomyces indicus]|uniref:DUF5134 domain-containing protein n=1 Tax=Streptomyces indicus TaxID=417292 RepID=A0A1G8TG54_9ACTN|nr:DUF5134 domain-containing protein [Streptomyces indicus]SDJ40498.1 protein of unknown function [Streptomyces indicus]